MQYAELFAVFTVTIAPQALGSRSQRIVITVPRTAFASHTYRNNPKIEGVPLKLHSTLQTPPTPQNDNNGPATESRHRPSARSPTHGDFSVA